MLIEVGEFCRRIETDMAGLIDQLQEITGRHGQEERRAWERSLPQLSVMLAKPQLRSLHLHLGQSAGMAVEYRLPASSSWCDVVLLGQHGGSPAVVIVELKDWDTAGDASGPREGLVVHRGAHRLHPSEQVRGYAEYCQLFHSTVQDEQAAVAGCVYFTRRNDLAPYRAPPHRELARKYPLFSNTPVDVDAGIVPFIASRLSQPDKGFAERFEAGTYKQDRGFVLQIAAAIKRSTKTPFVLLDEQRRGFQESMRAIDRLLASKDTAEKLVVIIEGPPGSGKSAIAAQLWAELAQDPRLSTSIVVTTTSVCQRSNWQHLFASLGRKAARGVVKGANAYNPGLSTQWVKKQRARGVTIQIPNWKRNIEHFLAENRIRVADNAFNVSIVDEAHALIDPTAPNAEGVPPSGWTMHAGPQAWHIIRASRVSIFLMDGEQSYRDNETTTRDQISRFAKEQGVGDVEVISLAGHQFRCGGSTEYVTWMEQSLGLRPDAPSVGVSWRRRAASGAGRFVFEILCSPDDIEKALRDRLAEGSTARFVANYARPWKTKGLPDPHAVPPDGMDFHIPLAGTKPVRHWSRAWNYAPDEDYSLFIQAPEGSAMHRDPLCEVGCPYVVRGFDFDYLGVLWLSDLVWRDDRWQHQLQHIHESAWKKTIAAAKPRAGRTPTAAAIDQLMHRLKRGYRILLSRAIRGVYLWVEDDETRDYLTKRLEG